MSEQAGTEPAGVHPSNTRRWKDPIVEALLSDLSDGLMEDLDGASCNAADQDMFRAAVTAWFGPDILDQLDEYQEDGE